MKEKLSLIKFTWYSSTLFIYAYLLNLSVNSIRSRRVHFMCTCMLNSDLIHCCKTIIVCFYQSFSYGKQDSYIESKWDTQYMIV